MREPHSEYDLLKSYPDNKYDFALAIGYRAECALFERGICKDWQMADEEHSELQRTLQASLMHTFTSIRQLYENVPLYRAKPQWASDREKHAWVLELDVGRVAIEVGPKTDKSLIEPGAVNTGYELPEFCKTRSELTKLRCTRRTVLA